MDYSVVESDSIAVLMQKVNGYIEIGWQPLGGISAVRPSVSGPVHYHQAVLKNGSSPYMGPVYRMKPTPKKKRIRRWHKRPPDFKDDPSKPE